MTGADYEEYEISGIYTNLKPVPLAFFFSTGYEAISEAVYGVKAQQIRSDVLIAAIKSNPFRHTDGLNWTDIRATEPDKRSASMF